MSKSDTMYKDSPRAERNESGKMEVKRSGEKKASPMGTMNGRHEREMAEAHRRHEEELKAIHSRHEKEAAAIAPPEQDPAAADNAGVGGSAGAPAAAPPAI